MNIKVVMWGLFGVLLMSFPIPFVVAISGWLVLFEIPALALGLICLVQGSQHWVKIRPDSIRQEEERHQLEMMRIRHKEVERIAVAESLKEIQ